MAVSDKRDFDDMMRLWRDSFSDDETYVRDYLLSWRPRGKSFVKRADGNIVSAADVHMFDSNGIRVAYIFGVMTDKRFRNMGLASSLVSEILSDVGRSGGFLSMLIAGDDRLAEWYRGLGFSSRSLHPVSLVSDDGSFDFGTGSPELNLPQFRIVDVAAYLEAYSERVNPVPFSVCVSDRIIEGNNGVFSVAGGKADRLPDGECPTVTVSQLADLCPLALSDFSYIGANR